MNLELRSIVSPGDLENERLTLRALADLDVGDYLVAQTGYVEGSPTTALYHTIWFPFKPVQKGDLIVIYTKVGTNSERVLGKGNKAHFFYLDLREPIWQDTGKAALVMYAPSWATKSVEEFRKT
jgi:hypothetical protein